MVPRRVVFLKPTLATPCWKTLLFCQDIYDVVIKNKSLQALPLKKPCDSWQFNKTLVVSIFLPVIVILAWR